jgi:hypothetical protein
LNRGDDPSHRDIADADEDPVVAIRFQGFKVSKFRSRRIAAGGNLETLKP